METLTWTFGNSKSGAINLPDQRLTFRFDGETNRVELGNRVYDASQGNLFVVRLDQRWAPTVNQVAVTIRKHESLTEVMQEFKRALPTAADIQNATLHSQMPPK